MALVIPQNLEETRFSGYITSQGEDYYVSLEMKERGRLGDATLECEWRLQQLLLGYEGIIQQRLQQAENVSAFFQELQSIVERLVSRSSGLPTNPALCGLLVTELEQLGWDRLISVEPNFSKLRLKVVDAKGRSHVLSVELPSQYPVEPPKCFAVLPGKFDLHWEGQSSAIWTFFSKPIRTESSLLLQQSSLASVVAQFEHCVAGYQEFWAIMDEVDRETWVLEPDPPTRDAVHRRIAIDPRASLQLRVDPDHPRELPECLLVGADQVVSVLKRKFNENIHQWDTGMTLLGNLREILDLDFPSPATSKKEDFSIECGICFTYELGDEKADKMCDNPSCGQIFHNSCLFEWLRSLTTSRQSFDMIFGECPSCDKPITVRMVSKPVGV